MVSLTRVLLTLFLPNISKWYSYGSKARTFRKENKMWIFSKQGFASVVEHRDDPAYVLVRCRCASDAQFFATRLGVSWFTDDLADYRYRMEAGKSAVAKLAGELVGEIDYDNFKNALPKDDPLRHERHEAYLRVWSVMHGLQDIAEVGA